MNCKSKFAKSARICFLTGIIAAILSAYPVAVFSTGTLMLVGDVLPLNSKLVWRNLVKLANRKNGGNLVVPAASSRPKLYGQFATRAYDRYGESATLLPFAEKFQEFSTDYRVISMDPEIAESIAIAKSIFFVGGAPHRLSDVLFWNDNKPSNLVKAIRTAHSSGTLIVGGIPAIKVVATTTKAIEALRSGSIEEPEIHKGLGIMKEGWYVDQHFFSDGRFATALVAMHQLGMQYGVGIAAETAAVVYGSRMEVVGNRGIVVVDLSDAIVDSNRQGFRLTGARLSYLENGDIVNLDTLKMTPYSPKTEGFELIPDSVAIEKKDPLRVTENIFGPGNLVRLMIGSLEQNTRETVGTAFDKDRISGFKFRFYTDESSRGWLTAQTGEERYSILGILLDVEPVE